MVSALVSFLAHLGPGDVSGSSELLPNGSLARLHHFLLFFEPDWMSHPEPWLRHFLVHMASGSSRPLGRAVLFFRRGVGNTEPSVLNGREPAHSRQGNRGEDSGQNVEML